MNFYLFDSWASLLRVVISGVGAYVCLIFFLRIAGNRILAKLNAFDLVVTVSPGCHALAGGGVALVVLIGLQFVITWSSIRVAWLRHEVLPYRRFARCPKPTKRCCSSSQSRKVKDLRLANSVTGGTA